MRLTLIVLPLVFVLIGCRRSAEDRLLAFVNAGIKGEYNSSQFGKGYIDPFSRLPGLSEDSKKRMFRDIIGRHFANLKHVRVIKTWTDRHRQVITQIEFVNQQGEKKLFQYSAMDTEEGLEVGAMGLLRAAWLMEMGPPFNSAQRQYRAYIKGLERDQADLEALGIQTIPFFQEDIPLGEARANFQNRLDRLVGKYGQQE